jgi:hypothetical protein
MIGQDGLFRLKQVLPPPHDWPRWGWVSHSIVSSLISFVSNKNKLSSDSYQLNLIHLMHMFLTKYIKSLLIADKTLP